MLQIQLWERTKNNKELELRNLKKEKEKYITEKDEELSKLKAQIEEIDMNKKKKMNELETESKKDQESMKKAFDEKVRITISLCFKFYRNLNC